MLTKTPGYIRMLTRSHRFVVPMQAVKFEASVPRRSLRQSPNLWLKEEECLTVRVSGFRAKERAG